MSTPPAAELSDAVPAVLASAARPRYVMAELIHQCDLEAPLTADWALWDVMPAVGREILDLD